MSCPICKICSCPIKDGAGLQCQGACGTWLHFRCLNYSSSKIAEIKCGNIKVLCPCPGCNAKGKRCGIKPSSVRVLKPGECVVDDGRYRPCSKPIRGSSSDTFYITERPDTCVSKCPSLATVETMCKKLEKLTCQINQIVVKMKDHISEDENCRYQRGARSGAGCCSCSKKCAKKKKQKC